MSWAGPVLQGIGDTGEDIGKGAEANTLQQHQFTMDYLANQARNRSLGMEQQNLDQQNSIAHSQLSLEASRQDLERQQFERQGLQYSGDVRDDAGNYYKSYTDPLKGTSTKVAYPTGVVPMSSPEGMIRSRKVLTDAGFDQDTADQVLFKVNATNNPTEQISTLIAWGKTTGAIPSDMPQSQAFNWATNAVKEMRGGFNAYDPLGLGGQAGWTPTETAEYGQLVTQPQRDSENTYRNQMQSYNEMINKLPPVSPVMDMIYKRIGMPTPRETAQQQAETLRKAAEDAHTSDLTRLQQLGQQLTMQYNARHGSGPFRSTGPAEGVEGAGAAGGSAAAGGGNDLFADEAGNLWRQTPQGPVFAGKAPGK
jgi:hypothetical protein